MIPLRASPARLALVVLTAAALTACASRPRPMGPVATEGGPPPPPSHYSPAPPTGEVTESQESGAPVPGSARDFVINAGDVVYFDFDSYTLRDDARPVLESQAGWLRRYPGVHVRIEGNCDERGTREYNFALGARRANAVREFLVGHGLSPARIATISYGKERPVDPGTGEEARAHNRNARTAVTEGAR
ncbi:MAG TPA: peptidoglycan-associated lipoprotein Pal [Caulobacteraceae bacterium]|nr:peptidoglycan-associated lipoprotein Pal [Caulobacteraceae bacterium]